MDERPAETVDGRSPRGRRAVHRPHKWCLARSAFCRYNSFTSPENQRERHGTHPAQLDHELHLGHRRRGRRLQAEIGKRGVIDVLRKGVQHGPHALELSKQFSDNESFRRGLMDAVFALTYASA